MNSNYYVDTSYGVSTSSGLTGAIATMGLFFWILFMALSILMIVSLWKIFKKAGKPGWASIVPIYNIYIMCEIAEKEWWYVLLSCVPFVNIYAMIVLYNGMAKKFGKGGGFVVGMFLLPVVFFPMLAFGKDATIVNNQPNTSNENNMADNTLGTNANALHNMNEKTMIANEMVTPNNPVMSEPVMSNPVGSVPFGNTSVETGLNSQNVNVGQNIDSSLESNQNISAMNEPVMPQSNDNVAPSFDNANNNANQSVNEEVSSNAKNAMNTAFSTQEEMLDINDESDAALENNINTSKHTSLWSNNNQNNGQM